MNYSPQSGKWWFWKSNLEKRKNKRVKGNRGKNGKATTITLKTKFLSAKVWESSPNRSACDYSRTADLHIYIRGYEDDKPIIYRNRRSKGVTDSVPWGTGRSVYVRGCNEHAEMESSTREWPTAFAPLVLASASASLRLPSTIENDDSDGLHFSGGSRL